MAGQAAQFLSWHCGIERGEHMQTGALARVARAWRHGCATQKTGFAVAAAALPAPCRGCGFVVSQLGQYIRWQTRERGLKHQLGHFLRVKCRWLGRRLGGRLFWRIARWWLVGRGVVLRFGLGWGGLLIRWRRRTCGAGCQHQSGGASQVFFLHFIAAAQRGQHFGQSHRGQAGAQTVHAQGFGGLANRF